MHHVIDPEHAQASGFDPAAYVSPADVAARLDEDWAVEVDDERARHWLTRAHDALTAQAAMISGEELRALFLNNIPHHRAIVDAWEARSRKL